jgi:FHS family L-fucose permease-like MFS transporter
MVGRFMGALALSDKLPPLRQVLMMPGLAFLLFMLLYLINAAGGGLGVDHLWPMGVLILGNMAAFMLAGRKPARALAFFALIAAGLVVAAVLLTGAWAMWALVAVGLFNSILWSNIFTLGIHGLGHHAGQGSSLLVMMIVGGALLPPLQGLIADAAGLQVSFLLPVACYAYLAWYGLDRARHA